MEEHPATDALRARSPELLVSGLGETLTEGEREWAKDVRELLVALAPFHDCARRLGLDAADVFRQAAELGPPELRETVIEFGRRTDISPAAFAFAVEDAPGGPRYRSTLWPYGESPEEYFGRLGWLD
jgi:hypothetical protein